MFTDAGFTRSGQARCGSRPPGGAAVSVRPQVIPRVAVEDDYSRLAVEADYCRVAGSRPGDSASPPPPTTMTRRQTAAASADTRSATNQSSVLTELTNETLGEKRGPVRDLRRPLGRA